MGSDSGIATKRVINICDYCFLDHVSLPIPSQDLSLCMPLTTNAKLLWLHFRHCLVGNNPQPDRVFCRITCNRISNFSR